MDLQAQMSTIATTIPDQLENILSAGSSLLPQELTRVLKQVTSYVPVKMDIITAAQFMLYFSLGSLILGCLGRVVLGKRSSLNHAMSSTVGILFVYVLTIVVYTFKPWNLDLLLAPLPFVHFSDEYMFLLPIGNSRFPALCSQVLSLILLAFLVNLLDTILPRGKNAMRWYLLRLLTVASAMLLHLGTREILSTYLPEVLVSYAPTVLLCVLAFMLLGGIINLILGIVITMTDPFLGAMYTFFFSNIVGKQLSKAVFSSTILCGIVYLMEYFGFTLICITAEALLAYIPLVLVLLLLWYLIGRLL